MGTFIKVFILSKLKRNWFSAILECSLYAYFKNVPKLKVNDRKQKRDFVIVYSVSHIKLYILSMLNSYKETLDQI